MNNKEVIRSIAIIDTCNYTCMAISSICRHISDNIIVYTFSSVEELLNHRSVREFDFIFYDILTTCPIVIDPENDILKIKSTNPHCKVCLLSVLHQFMYIKNADFELDKRLPLDDFSFFIRILCRDTQGKCKRNYSVIFHSRLDLTKEQVSLLRGYLYNLNTKEIAELLQCNLRKVYFYREGAIKKGHSKKSFFRAIGRLVNP
ncbi:MULTISPECIES: hypothetical protein [Tatumella]|uniref:LuxR family transcriptional regulator n=1 Tax=Tatumella terrea TaxID=419007 RepID=A0ABW1VW04_9GAMM|nr:hypothetical protein [Tatumella sp. JGM118]MBS0910322.1 hypothetical protein [Tatumella sp. JGM118]